MPLDSGLRIDWHKGRWRIWSLEHGAKLAEATRVVCDVPCEFVNCDKDTRGFGIAVGEVTVEDDTAIIRRAV